MAAHQTPDEDSTSDELLEALQSADPAEAPDIADALAASLAEDLGASEDLTSPKGSEEPS